MRLAGGGRHPVVSSGARGDERGHDEQCAERDAQSRQQTRPSSPAGSFRL